MGVSRAVVVAWMVVSGLVGAAGGLKAMADMRELRYCQNLLADAMSPAVAAPLRARLFEEYEHRCV